MIQVDITEKDVIVKMPVPKDPENAEETAICTAAIVEDLVYLYKTIEYNYDSKTLDFILKLAVKTFTFHHDKLVKDDVRIIKNEGDNKRK